MKLKVLSTYIAPEQNSVEERINQILLGSEQLNLMAGSLAASGHKFEQHVISSENIQVKNAKIKIVKNVNKSFLTLEILRLHRDYLRLAEEGDLWIVCDPDFLFFNDISCAFEGDFDIAMTVRESADMPHNSGIFFIKNKNNSAYRFFNIQVSLVEQHFMNNAQWFGDQLVLKHIVQHSKYKSEEKIFEYGGLKIKLLDAQEFNYSANREHPNLLVAPACRAYHFKGRCRSYMRYFYRHYVDKEDRPLFWQIGLLFDFFRVELERKWCKHLYEANVIRHKPKQTEESIS